MLAGLACVRILSRNCSGVCGRSDGQASGSLSTISVFCKRCRCAIVMRVISGPKEANFRPHFKEIAFTVTVDMVPLLYLLPLLENPPILGILIGGRVCLGLKKVKMQYSHFPRTQPQDSARQRHLPWTLKTELGRGQKELSLSDSGEGCGSSTPWAGEKGMLWQHPYPE